MSEFTIFSAKARCFIEVKLINIKRKTSIPYKVIQEFFNILKVINNYTLITFPSVQLLINNSYEIITP